MPLRTEIDAAVARVIDAGCFIGGSEVAAFEEEFATALDVPHAVSVASGTDALVVALRALGVGPGDDVITTPVSFVASAQAIVRVGARPIFADVDAFDWNLSPAAVASALSDYVRAPDGTLRAVDGRRLAAILVVHIFGAPADVELLASIAAEQRIFLIEDAAQAFGATVRGASVGGFGDAGCFSLFPTKTLGAMGDGGVVVTRDSQAAERMRRLRSHGANASAGNEVYEQVGYNSRLDALQASVLRVKLPHAEAWNEERRALADGYRERLRGVPGLSLQQCPRDQVSRVFHQFVVRGTRRFSAHARLRDAGIETREYYLKPLNEQVALAGLSRVPRPLPCAESVCGDLLALPIFPGLTHEMVKRVADEIAAICTSET